MSIRDLSERLKSQEKLDTTTQLLKETVNRLNKTLDASMDVICTIDAEGKFVDVNAASLKKPCQSGSWSVAVLDSASWAAAPALVGHCVGTGALGRS